MTTLETIFQRLEAIQKQIAGIAEVSALTPRNVRFTPTFVNNAGEANYSTRGYSGMLVTRNISMLMLVAQATGEDGAAESAAFALLDPVHIHFLKRRNLQLTGGDEIVEDALIIRDSGVQTFEYPANTGMPYIGVNFTLQVRYFVGTEGF